MRSAHFFVFLGFIPSFMSIPHIEVSSTAIPVKESEIPNATLPAPVNDSLVSRHSHDDKHKHDCPFGHSDNPIFLTDKEDPTKYFRCQDGASILFQCPAELKFDVYVKGCVWFLTKPIEIPSPSPTPCPHVTPKPTTPPPPKCGCMKPKPPTTKPTPKPCGCQTAKPAVPTPCSNSTTPCPVAPTPAPCSCTTPKPTTTSAPCNHGDSCTCNMKPKPVPTPAPCNHGTPDPCQAKPGPIPDAYTTKKPEKLAGRPTTVSAIPKCPVDDSNNPVFIPHPTDPSKFYQCSWGVPFECQCTQGLVFFVGVQACGWPNPLGSASDGINFDCYENKSQSLVLAHTSDDHKFYKIFKNAAYECCCPMSEVFDAKTKSCVAYKTPPCPSDLGGHPIYISHSDTRLFYECAAGKLTLFYCSTGMFFHPDKKACVTAKINMKKIR